MFCYLVYFVQIPYNKKELNTKELSMRNKLIGITLVIIVIIGIIIYYFLFRPVEIKINTIAQTEQKFDNQETFILVIGEKYCGACQEYKDKTLVSFVRKHSQNELILLYKDQLLIDERDLYNAFLDKYHITYSISPTVYYVKNGVIVNQSEERPSVKDLEAFLTSN